MRTRHRREDLERLLAQRDDEGLTFRELSEQSGIPVPTLSYWAAKLRREKIEESPSLVPVDVVDGTERAPIALEIGPELRLLVEHDFDATHLARLVSVLTARC